MNTPHPKSAKRAQLLVLLGLVSSLVLVARAQTTVAASGDTVKLDPFTVQAASQDDGYLTTQSLGSGRVRTSILDMPGSIQIINRNVIDDLGASRLIDAAKLVSGVTEGTIPNSVERYMMRGVSGDTRMIDGFTTFDQGNTDSVNIERLEIVKGPSSLLFANGPVGGLINQVTKSPQAIARGSLTAEVGQYESDRVELDMTGPLTSDKKLLYRIVGLAQDGDGYWEDTKTKKQLLAPSLSYQLTPNTTLLVKAEYFYTEVGGYNGVPYDAFTHQIVPVPARTNLAISTDPSYQRSHRRSLYGMLTTQLTDFMSMRLAARGYSSFSPEYDLISVSPPIFTTAGGNQNILRRIDAPLYQFSGGALQNDYVLNFHTGKYIRHNLVAGWEKAYSYQKTYRQSGPLNVPIDVFDPIAIPSGPINPAATTNTSARTDTYKGYVLEQMYLFNDKVIVSGGIVRNHYDVLSRNEFTQLNTSDVKGFQTTYQYGVVYQPVKGYSLYYAHNENFQPGGNNLGIQLPNTQGKMGEVGIKTLLLNDRLTFSTAYYDIQIANATQLSTTINGPVVVALPNTTSRGWEFDLNYVVMPGWNLIASWSSNLSRSGAGIQTRGAPREMGSLWTSYRIRKGDLKGLGFAVGTTYSADKPGDFADSFRLPAYTLVNGAVYYETKHYRLALNIDNALNKLYASSSLNASRVYLGPERNVRLTATYKF